MGAAPLLEVKDLVKHFPIYKGWLVSKQIGSVKALDGISLHQPETLGWWESLDAASPLPAG